MRPIVQVKENRSDFEPGVRSGLCEKGKKLYKHELDYQCDCCQVIYMPPFTCSECKPIENFYSRCKTCNKEFMTWKRCKAWKRDFKSVWGTLKKRNPKKFKTLKFITLTIKNPITEDYRSAEHFKKTILKPWRKFIRRMSRRGIILGGLYAYEYTYDEQDWQGDLDGHTLAIQDNYFGEPKLFKPTVSHHPHLHVIAVGPRVPQQELLREWRECCGHQNAGVHIKAIEASGDALGYITKYITKSAESGRNRNSFGIMRGLK